MKKSVSSVRYARGVPLVNSYDGGGHRHFLRGKNFVVHSDATIAPQSSEPA